MTNKELRERQSWTLSQKVQHSMDVISQFVERMGGVDKVYVSFSGGKDSTVLLDIARRLYPDILAVFCMTGNEYPDICRFVREKKNRGENVHIIRPKLKPQEVWERYGFPLVSKVASENIHAIRTNSNSVKAKKALGIINPDSMFVFSERWRFLIHEPYECSNRCCDVLKKNPAHKFQKDTGRSPILGVMASESLLREKSYIRNGGCNVFTGNAKSMPLSIWTDDDIWAYIRKFDVKIADIYHKGAKRTGCVGCGFGIQFKNDVRMRLLYREYPKFYRTVMNYTNNGVTFRYALRKVLATNGLYLPDEGPRDLFYDVEQLN